MPAEPGLFDLVRVLPTLDTTRATLELLWRPQASALDAVMELVGGIAAGSGTTTGPLAPDGPRARVDELLSSVGGRALGGGGA